MENTPHPSGADAPASPSAAALSSAAATTPAANAPSVSSAGAQAAAANPQTASAPCAETTPTNAAHLRRREWLSMGAMLLAPIIWGWGFVFTRFALEAGLSPSAMLFGRFAVAALLMGIVFFPVLRKHLRLAHWKGGIIVGAFVFTATLVQATGMQTTSPGNSAFITSAYVVIVPILWWVLTRQRIAPVVGIACVLCLAGVGILSLEPSQGFAIGIGDALTLLCALLYAGHIVAIEKCGTDIHPLCLAFMQFAVAAVLGFFTFLFLDGNFVPFASTSSAISMLYLGMLSTCVGFTLQTVAQKYVPSAKAGILLSTESLFGALFSVVAGYDNPSPRMLIGGAVVFVAVILPDAWPLLKTRLAARHTPTGL